MEEWRRGGGGGNRFPACLAAKLAVEFPQVLASLYNNMLAQAL